MANSQNKLSNLFSSKKFMLLLSFLGLYLLSSGTSWAIFSYLRKEPELDLSGDAEDIRDKIAGLPKTEECPINGMMYTQPERVIWEKRRPITAIIENHHDSRPPSGISKADVVYEAVAEGGITRFLSIFYCGASAEEVKIAPVRSARVYYIDWASEYGDQPIFMHVGGANDYAGYGDTARDAKALELLESIGWRYSGGNDFDTTYDSGFPVFWRNYERLNKKVATEHTMMASLDEAYDEAARRGFTDKGPKGDKWDKRFIAWKFTDDAPEQSPSADEISFGFWQKGSLAGQYDVVWKYDIQSNSYKRENGGKPHVDLVNNLQVTAKNVVIQFVVERGPVDRNLHMLYTTIGEGAALVFQNGKVIKASWEKDARTARTKFFDPKGKEVEFVRGPIWIEAVPKGNDIEY